MGLKISFLLTKFVYLLCIKNVEVQNPTCADIPGLENVLVFYNLRSQTSIDINDYYQNARGIPENNIVGLGRLVDTLITDPETQTEHSIELRQQGEIIMDVTNEFDCLATPHAWIYFIDRISKNI